jgi:hypothetical protein
LTLFPPPRILELTESCTTFLMTPDLSGVICVITSQTNPSPSVQSRSLNCRIRSCRSRRSVSRRVRASAFLIRRPSLSCPAPPSLHGTTRRKRCQSIA